MKPSMQCQQYLTEHFFIAYDSQILGANWLPFCSSVSEAQSCKCRLLAVCLKLTFQMLYATQYFPFAGQEAEGKKTFL